MGNQLNKTTKMSDFCDVPYDSSCYSLPDDLVGPTDGSND